MQYRQSPVAWFAVYQKKPEYGPAAIVATEVQLKSTEEEYWLEVDSSLSINGRAKTPNKRDLAQVIYATN